MPAALQVLESHRTIEATCRSCDATYPIRVPGYVDLLKYPEFSQNVATGDCFRIGCPKGHIIDVDVPILVRRDDGKLFYVPGEATPDADDDAALYAVLTALPEEIGRQISDPAGRIAMLPLTRGLLAVALAPSQFIRSLLTPQNVPDSAQMQEAKILAPEVLDLLANHLATTYDYAGNPIELEVAIALSALAVELTPPGHHNRAAHLGNLANHLDQRYARTRKRADLELAIEYATAALGMVTDVDPRLAGFHNNLAGHLFERMKLTANAADLDHAIEHADAALRLTPLDHEARPGYLSNIANYLSTRFMLTRNATNLDAAIEHAESALRISKPKDLGRPSQLNALAICLSTRFETAGRREDLEAAIEHTKIAVELLSEGHVDRPVMLSNLSNHLSSWFELTGAAADLDAAIGFAERAVAASQENDSDWSMYLNGLGNRLASRFARSGAAIDIDNAIRNLEEAVRHAPESYEKRPAYLGNLAAHLSSRFKIRGNSADLDAAIEYAQVAVDTTPERHADRSIQLSGLASHLATRFARSGARADLDAAIAHAEAALGRTSKTSTDRPMLLGNLAGYLDARFTLTGARADIDNAIDYAQQALALAPPSHVNSSAYLNNLANYLVSRARLTKEMTDIDAAVLHSRAALEHHSATRVDTAARHNTFANMLSERYRISGVANDLDASIVHAETAVQLTSDGHGDLPGRLNNLANRLALRFNDRSRMADIDAAIEKSIRAVNDTPEGHGYRPGYLQNLSSHYYDRYLHSGTRSDLDAAVEHAQAALLAWQRGALESEDARAILARAGQSARRVLDLLLIAGEPAGLVSALETGKAVRLRVELAGSGRSPSHLDASGQAQYQSVRSDLRQLRGDLRALDALPARLPSHAADVARIRAREAELRSERDRLEAGDPAFSAMALDFAAVRQKAIEAHEAIVYLQPLSEPPERLLAIIVHPASPPNGPAAADMLEIAGFGRSAVRTLLFAQSNKLSAAEGTFLPVADEPLGWLTADWAAKQDRSETARRRWRDTMARVVTDLGHLMTPITRRLDVLRLERVVLIPGESLGLLPLHAGPVGDGRPFGEHFETRYAPSATALHAAHPAQSNGTGYRLVGIANPDGSLPFADIEMRRVTALFGGAAHIAHGRAARRDWLLAEAGKGDLIALSTHASFSMSRPETSAFMLAHPQGRSTGTAAPALRAAIRSECETLSLDDILRGALRLTPGVLIVADACETGQMATGDAAEEFVGFPAAFLSSGASAVIASLWSVADFSTALLMEEMYRRIRSGESPVQALQGAASWLRQVPRDTIRSSLETELSAATTACERIRAHLKTLDAAAQDVDTSYDDAARLRDALHQALIRLENGPPTPFEHPFYWAPFAFHGRDHGQQVHSAPVSTGFKKLIRMILGPGSKLSRQA